jgi:hypothetical protein
MYKTNFSQIVEEPFLEVFPFFQWETVQNSTRNFLFMGGNQTARGLQRIYHYISMFPSHRRIDG